MSTFQDLLRSTDFDRDKALDQEFFQMCKTMLSTLYQHDEAYRKKVQGFYFQALLTFYKELRVEHLINQLQSLGVPYDAQFLHSWATRKRADRERDARMAALRDVQAPVDIFGAPPPPMSRALPTEGAAAEALAEATAATRAVLSRRNPAAVAALPELRTASPAVAVTTSVAASSPAPAPDSRDTGDNAAASSKRPGRRREGLTEEETNVIGMAKIREEDEEEYLAAFRVTAVSMQSRHVQDRTLLNAQDVRRHIQQTMAKEGIVAGAEDAAVTYLALAIEHYVDNLVRSAARVSHGRTLNNPKRAKPLSDPSGQLKAVMDKLANQQSDVKREEDVEMSTTGTADGDQPRQTRVTIRLEDVVKVVSSKPPLRKKPELFRQGLGLPWHGSRHVP